MLSLKLFLLIAAMNSTTVFPQSPASVPAFDAESFIQQNKFNSESIEKIVDYLKKQQDDLALSYFADSVEVLIVGNGSSQPKGRNDLRHILNNVRNRGLSIDVQLLRTFKVDQLYIVHYQITGSTAPGGEQNAEAQEPAIMIGCLAFLTVKDGMITRWENYHNPVAFYRPTDEILSGEAAESFKLHEVIEDRGALKNEELIQQYYQAINLNSDTIRASFFTPDAEMRNQANGTCAQGVEEIKARWSLERAVYSSRIEMPSQIQIAGNYAIVRSAVIATYQGDAGADGTQGKEVIFHPAAIYQLNDGRIKSVDYFYNEMELVIQLGTIP